MKKVNNIIYIIDEYISKNYRIIIGGIIFIQLLIFVLMFSKYGVVDAVDAQSYFIPAKDFIKNGTMHDGSGPTLIRTPGYILFLSLVYFLTNYSDVAVVIIQIIMSLSITYMIYYLVDEIVHKKSLACIASFFYICDMAIYDNALSIITDTLFPFLLILSLLFFFKYIKERKYIHIFLCFLTLNYCLAVRPQILYLNLILNFILLLLLLLKKINFKVLITYVLMFCMIFVGWSYRNYVQFNEFNYAPLRERDYFLFYAPYVYEVKEDTSYEVALEHFENVLYENFPDVDDMKIMEQVKIMSKIGKDYVKENISVFVYCNFRNLFVEMIGPNVSTIEKLNFLPIITLLIKLFVAGMLTLSYLIYAFCFLRTLSKQKWFDWMILLIVMYLMASTAIVGYSRYRLAFYPLCLIGTFTCYKKKYSRIKD